MSDSVRLRWKKVARTVLVLAVLILPGVALAASDSATETQHGNNTANAAVSGTQQRVSSENVLSNVSMPDVIVPDTIYPGQAFLVQVRGAGLEAVDFIWRKQSLTVPANTDSGAVPVSEILLPVPYGEKIGKTAILRLRATVNGKTVSMERKLPIKYKKYPEQSLSVDSRFVQLSKKDLERSKRERAETLPVLKAFTPKRFWTLPFERSVPGNLRGGISSYFGLRRVFNGEPRGHHRGLDLRASQGTPIRACADGIVAIAADHFFSGNVVYIDHGQGVVTLYAHMSRIAAKPGQSVKAGDIIGYVGSTGRVTGPHLHLGLCVQGVSVDVLPFLEKDKPDSVTVKQKTSSVNAKSVRSNAVSVDSGTPKPSVIIDPAAVSKSSVRESASGRTGEK